MQPEQWHRIRAIFEHALTLAADARARYLDEACAGDAGVRAEVEGLLAADAQATADDTSIGAAAPDLLESLHRDEDAAQRQRWVGRRVGAWRLTREIGRGGMGAVWLAERDDGAYLQQAAVKLMRPGWSDGELLRRFRAERQILAALNHPNIARLLDGGVADESPYLVLEYVDGEPIQRWCEQHQLGLEARLRLLLTVCDAVAHAHHRLVVHRDLKPSNILVDRDGRVKLLDFGIAKLLEGDGGREISAVRMFTPDYAAPEQVRGDAVTTGVDVYALGLLLYELLTGARPYGQTASTPAAYEQAILTQEPEAPSRALTRSASGSEPAIGNLDLDSLRRRLRGDLDAIVLKALRKRPEDRYASVEELAADLRRHLAREPVLALRGRWRYRALRFLQRHTLAAALATLAACSLLVGLAAALWQAEQARNERDLARREALKSMRALEFMKSVFQMADPGESMGKQVTAVELLERGAEAMQQQLEDEPDVRSALFDAIGIAQLGLGQAEAARPLLEQALADARRSGDTPRIAQSLLALGSALTRLGDQKADEALAREAQALALPTDARGEAVRAQIELRLAVRATDRSDFAVAEPLFRAGLERLERATGRIDPEVMIPYSALLHSTGRADAAEPLLRRAYEQLLRETPLGHPLRAGMAAQLATNYTRRGLPAQAEPLLRQALETKIAIYGDDHPSVDLTASNLARNLTELGRWADAEALYDRVLKRQRARHTGPHPAIAGSEAGLARALLDSGRAGESEALWRSAQATARATFGEFDAAVGITALGLGRALLELGRLDEADAQLALAQQVYERLGDNGRGSLAKVRLEQVRVALARNDGAPDCSSSEGIVDASSEPNANRGYALAVHAACLFSRGETAPAQNALTEALRLLRAQRGEQFPERRFVEALAQARR